MLARLILSAVAVGITAYFMDSVTIEPWWVTVIVAVVLGLINAVVRPVVKLLSLPLTLLTLGLFALVVNGLMVMLCAYFVDGFKVDGLGAAILFSIILAVVNWVLNMMFSND
ncbi:MAG: phage holin family protein [Muribaculaceae bacterium]|jgi:putative membrane protein|nr:phage holin family protein [Muribaculaceae bacterium]MBQ3910590.1 phage holin family protein [Muribaculaceae bacterium]